VPGPGTAASLTASISDSARFRDRGQGGDAGPCAQAVDEQPQVAAPEIGRRGVVDDRCDHQLDPGDVDADDVVPQRPLLLGARYQTAQEGRDPLTALRAKGISSTRYVLEGANHGDMTLMGDTSAVKPWSTEKVMNLIAGFLAKRLGT
jgi:hypothetical protein